MIKNVVLSSFLVLSACAIQPAFAQEQQVQCGPFAEVRKLLAETRHETEVGAGLINEQTAIVIYAEPSGKTWTMLSVHTNGTACVLASGAMWAGPTVEGFGGQEVGN